MRKWFRRAELLITVVVILAAISWTIGGVRALTQAHWGDALAFLISGAVVFFLMVATARKRRQTAERRRWRDLSRTTDDLGERVLVLKFGRSRLKVANAIHRLRAEANLPIALIDFRALPFVAGEALTDDMAARWVEELSTLGAVARVQ